MAAMARDQLGIFTRAQSPKETYVDIDQLRLLNDQFLKDLIDSCKQVLNERSDRRKAARRRAALLGVDNKAENAEHEANLGVVKFNSSGFYKPIGHGSKAMNIAIQYLPALMLQDWSSIFPRSGGDRRFYVYAHIDPSGQRMLTADAGGGVWPGRPFYIGKGCGDRAWDLKRNHGHGKVLRALTKKWSKEDIVKIVVSDLTESEAFEAEAKLIYFFGTVYGGSRGFLYNLDVPPTPKIIGQMRQMVTRQSPPITE